MKDSDPVELPIDGTLDLHAFSHNADESDLGLGDIRLLLTGSVVEGGGGTVPEPALAWLLFAGGFLLILRFRRPAAAR